MSKKLTVIVSILLLLVLMAALSGCAKNGVENLAERWVDALNSGDAVKAAKCHYPTNHANYKRTVEIYTQMFSRATVEAEMYSYSFEFARNADAKAAIDIWIKITAKSGDSIENRDTVTCSFVKRDSKWYFSADEDVFTLLGLTQTVYA